MPNIVSGFILNDTDISYWKAPSGSCLNKKLLIHGQASWYNQDNKEMDHVWQIRKSRVSSGSSF